ncbi:MAG: DUF5668 domain-containing protein [Mucilaginibacter sp.]
MRDNRIIPGVVLVLIGTAFLLNNYGVISLHWHNFFSLWPIFIVIAGVNLLFAHNRSVWATVIKLIVIVGGLGILLFGNFGNRYNMWPGMHFDVNDDNDMGNHAITKVEGNSNFVEAYTADAHRVKLNISGGGTNYILKDTTNQLFTADTREFYGKYEFNPNMTDSVKVLNFKMSNSHGNFNWGDNKKSNSATMKLNINPEWDININAGATSLDFDLSKFKIRSLDINGGAASFDVKLGQPLNESTIKVSTGVSDVNISIPKNAACSIKKHSGLSSSNFEGFVKQDDGNYETPGFATAKNKFYIKINGGVSDFNVTKY